MACAYSGHGESVGWSQLTCKERSDNLVTTPWTWKERCDNPVKTSSEWHAIYRVHAKLVLRRSSCHKILVTSLLRQYLCYCVLPHGVLARLRQRYVNFEHVQCSSTSSASMETTSRPHRFLLRSHGVVQVITASCRFFVDVVGT